MSHLIQTAPIWKQTQAGCFISIFLYVADRILPEFADGWNSLSKDYISVWASLGCSYYVPSSPALSQK